MPKTYTQDDVLADIRKVAERSSLRQTAERIGVSAAYLSDILAGNRAVSDTIAEAFGYEREIVTEVIFRKKAA
jgi:transcriptional regulator with XRE-family HTH domain